jgi:hypothetical protein
MYTNVKQNAMQMNPWSHERQSLITYRYIITDTTIYDHPPVTIKNESGTMTSMTSDAFIDLRTKRTYTSVELLSLLQHTGITAHTIEGTFLLCFPPAPLQDIINAAYRQIIEIVQGFKPSRSVIDADRQVHWVWFRKSPTWRLTNEIVARAASWIELNPTFQGFQSTELGSTELVDRVKNSTTFTFHLWTSLTDEAELADFIADLTPENRAYFDRIHVHYRDDFRKTVFDWLAANVNDETQRMFELIWNSAESQDIVMKTDYSRNILLAVHGGIYVDFNDLVCLSPIEPVLAAHAGGFAGCSDAFGTHHFSNYFMYAAAGNAEWNDIVRRCSETASSIYRMIHDDTLLERAKSVIERLIAGEDVDDPEILNVLYCGLKLLRKKQQTVANLRPLVTVALTDKPLDQQWRIWFTESALHKIMHITNLPIFCREQGIHIPFIPFSYFGRYTCLLSFIGHIGDGTSCGQDGVRKQSITEFMFQ